VKTISLKDIDSQIKPQYDSDSDNILEEFYIKVLSEAKYYRRVTGPFSSSILAGASKGISNFIKNDGKMQLICWATLSERDVEAIERGKKKPKKLIEEVSLNQLKLEEIQDKLIEDHLKALSWMIANGNLDIKIGVKKDENGNYIHNIEENMGDFHPKSGILKDKEKNEICFTGSGNESISGWKYNIEHLHVFKSWKEVERPHFDPEKEKIENYWKDNAERVDIFSFPQALEEKLINYSNLSKEEIIQLELERRARRSFRKKEKKSKSETKFNPNNEEPWDPQKEFIEEIEKSDYNGIVKMATGTGKTHMMLFCLEKYFNNKERFGNRILILVPEKEIGIQWKNFLDENSGKNDYVFPVPAKQSIEIKRAARRMWKNELNNKNVFRIENIQNLHNFKTYGKSPDFLIADEVHSYGTKNRMSTIKEKFSEAPYKLGLSATPSRYYDQEGTNRLFDFFGKIIVDYHIEKAQKEMKRPGKETVLSDYLYYPFITNLTNEEQDRVEKLTNEIRKKAAIEFSKIQSEKEELLPKGVKIKLNQRARKIKKSENKLEMLSNILNERGDDLDQCIVYCEDGEQLEAVKEVFYQEGFDSVIRYDGEVDRREPTLELFRRNDVNFILAMKLLDQGVDIPDCESAILLSNSGNPREYIQRRGRVLRNKPDKSTVKIFDVFVFPQKHEEKYRNLVFGRLLRAWEFIRCSNSSEKKVKFRKIRRSYDISEKELKKEINNW